MARLIDADALKALFVETLQNIMHAPQMTGEERHIICAIDTVGEMIDDAETVDAQPVVHGRWLPDMELFDEDEAVGIPGGLYQTGWKCSVCGRTEPEKEPYCNCGAKMDLEVQCE